MLVMGILNVTPDSFADGGLHYEESLAITHGLEMIEDGVDIIDVGGESTRPGADRITEEEEQARVIPVIRELAKKGVVISIDTMRATTAKLAVEAGASIVNDVSGGAADPDMFSTVAQLGCKYTLMHWRGHSKDMNEKAIYGDVVAEVIEEVTLQLDKALAAGVKRENIILDPGIGFAKNAEHNWEVLNRIDEFVALGYPVLIGHSRKRFLGGEHPDEREEATVAVTQSLVGKGIWAVRVHGVKANVKAARS
ncbi:dihydropteroate synthase [Candidatus Planktophila dulcis]|jgi:dihydropteroate synthase|uniref:Dihydropteroate synthase n=1 Tax=Candidatus Planktophila dulcis TaxID=1884914 RepID=A0AAC9YU20_9ACTN|nr:dihydropteroate synthase [Candidatus Planktophila dulcis]